ncbi:MAG: signal peptide peptidase SppA [Chitinivibrionales bacterium]|nr:signal peptide peptidase SppA [Chitinivibrionales bacterium]
MKRSHKIMIVAVILTPVVIGLVVTVLSQNSERGPLGGAKIGLVRVRDIIYESDSYVKQLKEYREDESVLGVIMRINSPGGTVAPAQEIFAEVMRYRAAQKPLIVSMENVAASGGYYIAGGADKIFANPGTLTGSFGVILRFPSYHKLMDKIGFDMITIKAGKFKDIGNPHREMTDAERATLSTLVENTHDQFINAIVTGRNMSLDSVRKYADGRIFTGMQAKELGFVDSLGGFETALEYLKTTLGLTGKVKLAEKKEREPLLKRLLTGEARGLLNVGRVLAPPAGAYYLMSGS